MAEVPVKEGGRYNTAQSGSDEDPIKIDDDDHTARGYMAEVPVKEGDRDNTAQSGIPKGPGAVIHDEIKKGGRTQEKVSQ